MANRKMLLVLMTSLITLSLIEPVHAQPVTKNEKKTDSGLSAKETLDLINVGMFIFAGGPQEIFVRLVFVAFTFAIMAATMAFLMACCGCQFDNDNDTLDTAISVGTACMLGQQLYENRSKYY